MIVPSVHLKPYKMRKLFFTLAASFLLSSAFCQENLDMDMIARIKKEGTDSSKVMDVAHHLTDEIGRAHV